MGMKNRRGNQKSPPVFSHEFVIQNHADIVSCFAMVFVVGLMFQATTPFSSLFVALGHPTPPEIGSFYTYGLKDISCIFFYLLICIIVQAVVQEYLIDRMNRKLHLSKVNHRKFNESGQLLVFYLVSVFWGANIAHKEGLLSDLTGLWSNYPDAHARMSFQQKFFFIIQIAYWLHQFPELYFQKIKKDEVMQRVQMAFQYLVAIVVAYLFNFTKLALCFLVIHYASESVFHVARILHLAGKQVAARKAFMVRNVVYVPVRILAIVASVSVFIFKLAKEKQGFDFATGNFNTQLIRLNCAISMFFSQSWLLWNYVSFHLRKRSERVAQTTVHVPKKKAHRPKPEPKQTNEEDVNELPEVDQNTSKDLRQRKVPAK
ncbi:unnamed protein product [Notodromas monacha]|uniref:Translocating chain-associated membrane protein n=1 Tax=Notodromas monacha TaxID=399045 RepID=A0A7R9BG23_9CRUS|nr:unnamed protein product [Notodromas monacha]CAG0914084.1 unnamed protein product [Notodromas monacha]